MTAMIGWGLAVLLALTSVSAAVSVWRPTGRLASGSRTALVASLLETAAVAVFFRLVVQWSPGTVILWVVAVAAFAAAAAGAVLRWPEMAGRRPEPAVEPAVHSAPGAGAAGSRATKSAKEPGRIAAAVRAVVLIGLVGVSLAAGPPL